MKCLFVFGLTKAERAQVNDDVRTFRRAKHPALLELQDVIAEPEVGQLNFFLHVISNFSFVLMHTTKDYPIHGPIFMCPPERGLLFGISFPGEKQGEKAAPRWPGGRFFLFFCNNRLAHSDDCI